MTKESNNPSFVFFGTSEFSVLILNALEAHGFVPQCVVTPPDARSGRKMLLTPPDVKLWANKRDIPVLQPEKLDAAFIKTLAQNAWDIFIVAAYGKLIPQELLSIPKKGSLNVHPSLLPLYRGPSPLQYQILNRDENVGVTIMLMDKEMDHGPILTQSIFPMPHDENHSLPTYKELSRFLGEKGGELLSLTIPKWLSGELAEQEQNHDDATFTKMITKKDAELSLDDDPLSNYAKTRAFYPNPGTFYFHTVGAKSVRVKIVEARLEDGTFTPLRVIPEGKKEMSYDDFLRGA